VPVTFHKLSGYDVHLFVKNLKGNSDCILNNEEKYISFSRSIYGDEKKFKYKIRFIDSYKFMDSNLDKLANNQNENQFKHIRQTFNDEQCRLSTRKGVYPYDYIDCLDKLDEKQLPPKAFYSRLYDSDITDEDYEHAQNVWKRFDIQTMRDYHNLCLKTDVLLLSDVFEGFRTVCLESYDLDPCWYYTAPGSAFHALLKESKVQLELFQVTQICC